MQVVINIPTELYERLMESNADDFDGFIEGELVDFIQNGTPLPKVHGDLIDKNELIKMYEKDCGRRIYADNFIFDLENNTTTIIEADKEKEE